MPGRDEPFDGNFRLNRASRRYLECMADLPLPASLEGAARQITAAHDPLPPLSPRSIAMLGYMFRHHHHRAHGLLRRWLGARTLLAGLALGVALLFVARPFALGLGVTSAPGHVPSCTTSGGCAAVARGGVTVTGGTTVANDPVGTARPAQPQPAQPAEVCAEPRLATSATTAATNPACPTAVPADGSTAAPPQPPLNAFSAGPRSVPCPAGTAPSPSGSCSTP